MTDPRELAQRIVAKIVEAGCWEGTIDTDELLQILTSSLAAEMPRWVPVAEKLPDEIGDYLVWIDFTITGVRTQYWEIATWGAGAWPEDATHWAALPSPPREEAP